MATHDWIFAEITPKKEIEAPQPVAIKEVAPVMAYGSSNGSYNNRVFYRPFDGEKNVGGIGPINKYYLDHDALRLRSWQLLLESEIVQIGISRSVMWTIGAGLKLRCEPEIEVLQAEGIQLDKKTFRQSFSRQMESRFKLFSKNRMSDFADMESLHAKAWEIEKNAIIGGDCLVLLSVVDGIPKVELKDGAHVRTPIFSVGISGEIRNKDTGNRIRNGVEIDDRGQHVAFWVRKGHAIGANTIDYMNYERVPARDAKTGIIRAFLYYGLRYRLDDMRGIPLISVCMETTKQLEMYKEATVAGAVERAKFAFSIEHELGSIGTNPFQEQLANGFGNPLTDLPKDIGGQNLSDTFAATTNKQAVNLPVGASAKTLESKQEIHFSEFYETNLSIIFAALDIPKEVGLMMFGSNYSASRAAIKDWAHTLNVRRALKVSCFYQPVYELCMLAWVLQNKISAPGYLDAVIKKNVWVTTAYANAKWQGDNVPNIDEKKEVDAIRGMLGEGSRHMPLITLEDAMERLAGNEFMETTEQYQEELQIGDDLGIEKVEMNKEVIEDFDDAAEDKPGKPGQKGNDQKQNSPTKKK